MDLFYWIDKISGRTYVDIAAELGWSYARLSRLARGLVRVDDEAARQIETLTKGAVTAASVRRVPLPRVVAVAPAPVPVAPVAPAAPPKRRGAARKQPVAAAVAPVAVAPVAPAAPPKRRGAARKQPVVSVVVAAAPPPPAPPARRRNPPAPAPVAPAPVAEPGRRGRPRQQPVAVGGAS